MGSGTKSSGVESPQPPHRKGPEVDLIGGAIEDQFGHGLAGRRRVQHAPDAVSGGDIGFRARRPGTASDQRQAIVGDRSKAGLPRRDRGRGVSAGEMVRHIASSRVVRALRRARPVGGIDRHSVPCFETAHTQVVPSVLGNSPRASGPRRSVSLTTRGTAPPPESASPVWKIKAVALVAVHPRQRQPARRQDRPRPHGDHHGVAVDGLAVVEHDAANAVLVAHQVDGRATEQRAAVLLGRGHQARGEGARLDDRARFGFRGIGLIT